MLGGLPGFTRKAGKLRSFERGSVPPISADVRTGYTTNIYKSVSGAGGTPLVLTINGPFRLSFLAPWISSGTGSVNLTITLTVDGVRVLGPYTNGLTGNPQGFVLVNQETGPLEGESLVLVADCPVGYSPGILYMGETYR